MICDIIPHDSSLLWGASQGDLTNQTFGDLELAVCFAWVPLLFPGLGCVGVLRTQVRHVCHSARLVFKRTGCKTIGRRGLGTALVQGYWPDLDPLGSMVPRLPFKGSQAFTQQGHPLESTCGQLIFIF